MCSSRITRSAFLALALAVAAPAARAQGQNDTYRFILFGGGGFTRNISTFDVSPPGLDKNGMSGTVRVMWKPEHLLSVGLEVGYHRVYGAESDNITTTLGTTSGKSTMDAIPIQIVLSLPVIDHFEVWAGSGFATVVSNVEFFGEKTTATSYTPYFFAAASYLYPVADRLRAGAEVRYWYADRYGDRGLSFQLMLAWTFLEY